jgi:hypothetical protein
MVLCLGSAARHVAGNRGFIQANVSEPMRLASLTPDLPLYIRWSALPSPIKPAGYSPTMPANALSRLRVHQELCPCCTDSYLGLVLQIIPNSAVPFSTVTKSCTFRLLGRIGQGSLVAYWTGGAFISQAYVDEYWCASSAGLSLTRRLCPCAAPRRYRHRRTSEIRLRAPGYIKIH